MSMPLTVMFTEGQVAAVTDPYYFAPDFTDDRFGIYWFGSGGVDDSSAWDTARCDAALCTQDVGAEAGAMRFTRFVTLPSAPISAAGVSMSEAQGFSFWLADGFLYIELPRTSGTLYLKSDYDSGPWNGQFGNTGNPRADPWFNGLRAGVYTLTWADVPTDT